MTLRPVKKLGRGVGPNVNYLRIPLGKSRRKAPKIAYIEAKSQLAKNAIVETLFHSPAFDDIDEKGAQRKRHCPKSR